MSNNQKTFFGHPIGLSSLFFTEFWERFSYYGMRGFFVLYLTSMLVNGGFGLEKTEAYTIYGIFTMMVYITPILGGILADKVLGQRKAIYIGALLMAAGQFTMAASVNYSGSEDIEMRQFFLYNGLGLLIIGNGFFKPNISTMVGGLYKADDPKKDGGFTLFYMGINFGALVTNFIGGTLAEKAGWQYGFMAAGVGMILSTIWFYWKESTVQNPETGEYVGLAPGEDTKTKAHLAGKDWMTILIYSLVSVVAVFAVIFGITTINEDVLNVIIYGISAIGVGYLAYTIYQNTSGKVEWNRVYVILVLAVFNIVFWSGFEQAGTSFNTFANEYTDRYIGLFDYEIPASWFQSVNALFIVILAPLVDMLYSRLTKIGKNPSTPMKFAIAMFFLSAGFFVMAGGNDLLQTTDKISPMWLVMVYLLHTIGELFLSPVGLSMITKLSPGKIVSVMMGLWMGSIALGNFLAAEMTKISTGLGYDTFTFIAFYALTAGVVAVLVSPLLRKLMHGIH